MRYKNPLSILTLVLTTPFVVCLPKSLATDKLPKEYAASIKGSFRQKPGIGLCASCLPNVLPIEDFLKEPSTEVSGPIKDSFQEEYTGVCICKEGVNINDVVINNGLSLPTLNRKEDRVLLLNLLKEAKNHLKAGQKYPLAFLGEKLWDPNITNDIAGILDSNNKLWMFQMTYVEHLLSAAGFRKLSGMDDAWVEKKKLEELFAKMLFTRALGQTGALEYKGNDNQIYISIGLQHPKGGTLVPSGIVVRDLNSNSHSIYNTLLEEASEELSPLISISNSPMRVVGYALNDVSSKNVSYYDPDLFVKLSERGGSCTSNIKILRGIFVLVEILESTAQEIHKMVEENPGIDFKKEVGVLQFQTLENAIITLQKGYNNKQNVEHIVVLQAYKDFMNKSVGVSQ